VAELDPVGGEGFDLEDIVAQAGGLGLAIAHGSQWAFEAVWASSGRRCRIADAGRRGYCAGRAPRAQR